MKTKIPKLIGISGCTNAGKTTLALKLKSLFPKSEVLFQDAFYHADDSGLLEWIEEVSMRNYDTLHAFNMNLFHETLAKIISTRANDAEEELQFIFIEGILIFEDERLWSMLDRKYFLRLSETESQNRRRGRLYDGVIDHEDYFPKVAWPSHLKYREYCESILSGIIYVDASDPPEKIVQFVSNDLLENI